MVLSSRRSQMGLSDYLDSSLDFGAGTGMGRDTESILDLLGFDGLRGSSDGAEACKGQAARKNPSAAVGGVKVRVPPPTRSVLHTR